VIKKNRCKILNLHRETLLLQTLDKSIQYDFLCNKFFYFFCPFVSVILGPISVQFWTTDTVVNSLYLPLRVVESVPPFVKSFLEQLAYFWCLLLNACYTKESP